MSLQKLTVDNTIFLVFVLYFYPLFSNCFHLILLCFIVSCEILGMEIYSYV